MSFQVVSLEFLLHELESDIFNGSQRSSERLGDPVFYFILVIATYTKEILSLPDHLLGGEEYSVT